jgi:hypothetical protein
MCFPENAPDICPIYHPLLDLGSRPVHDSGSNLPRVHPQKPPRANSFPVGDGVGKLRGLVDFDVDWWI